MTNQKSGDGNPEQQRYIVVREERDFGADCATSQHWLVLVTKAQAYKYTAFIQERSWAVVTVVNARLLKRVLTEGRRTPSPSNRYWNLLRYLHCDFKLFGLLDSFSNVGKGFDHWTRTECESVLRVSQPVSECWQKSHPRDILCAMALNCL